VSCPNVFQAVFVFFSPRLPLVALMGNYGMSTTSTNVTQNSKLQANNVAFKPSSRLHPSQTQLGIVTHSQAPC
jgi:hypothetical protein